MDDLLQRVAEPQEQIGRGRHSREIDVEQFHRQSRRSIEGGQKALGPVPAHVFQSSVKGHGHRGTPLDFGGQRAVMAPLRATRARAAVRVWSWPLYTPK